LNQTTISYHIIVTGKVQGVFFRRSAAKKANQLALGGWVKNNPNGSVEIEVEGGIIEVTEFVDWCRKGPEYAIVTGIEQKESALKSYSQFRIIR
jgi:acylphosphatase